MKTSRTSRTAAVEAVTPSELASLRVTLRNYYYLTKPGIIRGNLFTASAGYLLAAQGVINLWQLASMIVGLSFVIASGCVCNNYMDRQLDVKMARTRQRALVTGSIGVQHALIFASILGVSGVVILALGCNLMAAALGALGFIAYVIIYGIAKRRTVHSTVIGSASGAIPPLVGYAAAGHGLGVGSSLLFLILVCWQMPHFYAIAIYRYEDYKAAGLPVLSVAKGFFNSKVQMILYAAAYVAAVASLAILDVTSLWCGIILTLIGSVWLLQILRGLQIKTDDASMHWARQVFHTSLLVITLLCMTIGIDSFV